MKSLLKKNRKRHIYIKSKLFNIKWPFVNLGIGTSALELELELELELILQMPLFPVP